MLKKEAQIEQKNHEDEHRIEQRELKQDVRALKVSKNEQNFRHKHYLNMIQKDFNEKASQKRKEFERISNEIQLNFKHKMFLLRLEMDKKRKDDILKIEVKKNLAIKELTHKHEQKYEAIKCYYAEITNTNLDMIRQLKDDLTDAKKDDNDVKLDFRSASDRNAEIKGPYDAAIARCLVLKVQGDKHEKIKHELIETQKLIGNSISSYAELEWEFEVKN